MKPKLIRKIISYNQTLLNLSTFTQAYGAILFFLRAKRKIVLDLRRTKSTENLHIPDPCEMTETEDLASASKTEEAVTTSKKESSERVVAEEAMR